MLFPFNPQFGQLFFSLAKDLKRLNPQISLIICFRNESANIKQLLHCISAQTFQAFELILVDDFSTDNSLEIASSHLQQSTLNWQIIQLSSLLSNINAFIPNKKKGITLAIEAASADTILLTDADCTFNQHWISSLLMFYQNHNLKMGLGPVMYADCHSILEKFQQIDLIAMMALTKWTVQHRIPILSNGANMLFSKEAFENFRGYAGNESISSGDDVFLLQKFMLNKIESNYIEQEESMAFTKPEQTLKGFMNQRIRWASKTSGYKRADIKAFLLSVYILNVGIAALFLVAILGFIPIGFFAVCFFIKLFIDSLIIYPQAKFFRQRKLLFAMPLWETIHVLYVIIIGFLSLRKSYIWKERIIKS